jgi:NADPH:quinone reductase-like Zn-dependent oxidoreductase
MTMKAAVVTSFDAAPRFQEFPAPGAPGAGEMILDVLAAGLHPRVRSQASGSHYTSTGVLPLVPGIDGVGRGPDGLLRYFILDGDGPGAMAEQVLIDTRRSVVLPAGSNPVAVAAAMNPAMSSWVALRQRIAFEAGQDVLILGATGNAGRLAVQISRRLGARRVIAAGRDSGRLSALAGLGATDLVPLGGDDDVSAERLAVAANVDVVLDYVWGPPGAAAMAAIITGRTDRGQPLTWVEIGSVAGPTAPVPSAALRAARLQIVGSGQGSVATAEIRAELPALAAEITSGALDVRARAVPLADVKQAWAAPSGAAERIVISPGA